MKKTNKFLMNVLDRLKNYASGIVNNEDVDISENEVLIMRLMTKSHYKDLSTDQIIYLQNKIFSNTDSLLLERFEKAKKEIKSINEYQTQKTELLTIKKT